MAHVERLTVYPVKGLDGITLSDARVLPGGTLAHDREYALFDSDGDVVNGKRTDAVHGLDTDYDPDTHELAVQTRDGDLERFDLDADPAAAEAWFSDHFDLDLTLESATDTGYVDRPGMGPSVVSTETLRTIASWFDEMTVEGARRRLRANVEIDGVPAFWEDRFLGSDAPAFRADGVEFEGVTPCGRCVVPTRDPDTGDPIPRFRERFVERRRMTLPGWANEDAFDHFYSVMLIARVPEKHRGRTIETGSDVRTLQR